MKASETINVRLPLDLYQAVEQTALEQERSLSNVVRRVVSEWARRRQHQQPHSEAAA